MGARRHTHFALIGKFCEKRLSATIILTVDSCLVLNIEHINSIMNIDFLSVCQYRLTSSAIAEFFGEYRMRDPFGKEVHRSFKNQGQTILDIIFRHAQEDCSSD
jgi:hypothetical protein